MKVAQSCPTLCDPTDCSPLGSSVHGILQARVPEWAAISFSILQYRSVSKNILYILSLYNVVLQSLSGPTPGLHRLQPARFLGPLLFPRVRSYSCPLSKWCYLIISSSASPFSFCRQSFPASGSSPMSRLFASGGRSIGASASMLRTEYIKLKKKSFPGSPVLKTLGFHCKEHGFDPRSGN